MGLLREHTKKAIRAEIDDIVIYEPKRADIEGIRRIIEKSFTIDDELHAVGTLEVDTIKFMMRTLTNIGMEVDEYDDAEFMNLINEEGDRTIREVCDVLVDIVKEIVRDIQREQHMMIESLSEILDSVEASAKVEEIQEKYNNLIEKESKK